MTHKSSEIRLWHFSLLLENQKPEQASELADERMCIFVAFHVVDCTCHFLQIPYKLQLCHLNVYLYLVVDGQICSRPLLVDKYREEIHDKPVCVIK
jgi:hypothetical protein